MHDIWSAPPHPAKRRIAGCRTPGGVTGVWKSCRSYVVLWAHHGDLACACFLRDTSSPAGTLSARPCCRCPALDGRLFHGGQQKRRTSINQPTNNDAVWASSALRKWSHDRFASLLYRVVTRPWTLYCSWTPQVTTAPAQLPSAAQRPGPGPGDRNAGQHPKYWQGPHRSSLLAILVRSRHVRHIAVGHREVAGGLCTVRRERRHRVALHHRIQLHRHWAHAAVADRLSILQSSTSVPSMTTPGSQCSLHLTCAMTARPCALLLPRTVRLRRRAIDLKVRAVQCYPGTHPVGDAHDGEAGAGEKHLLGSLCLLGGEVSLVHPRHPVQQPLLHALRQTAKPLW